VSLHSEYEYSFIRRVEYEPTANLLDDVWIANLEAASDMSILTQQYTGEGRGMLLLRG